MGKTEPNNNRYCYYLFIYVYIHLKCFQNPIFNKTYQIVCLKYVQCKIIFKKNLKKIVSVL